MKISHYIDLILEGYPINNIIDEIYQINEVSIKQLKQKYPQYNSEIEKLQNDNINQKYYEYILIKLSENNELNYIINIIKNFDNLSKRFDKLIKIGLMDIKQKDITYWNKKPLNDLNTFMNNIESSDVLKVEQNINTSGSKVIYEDNRVILAAPLSKDGAINIGVNTKWCISATDDKFFKHWYDYIIKEDVFIIVIDKFANPFKNDHAKYALRYNVATGKFQDAWDVQDRGYSSGGGTVKFINIMQNVYGKDYWNKLYKIIIKYFKSADIIDPHDKYLKFAPGDEILLKLSDISESGYADISNFRDIIFDTIMNYYDSDVVGSHGFSIGSLASDCFEDVSNYLLDKDVKGYVNEINEFSSREFIYELYLYFSDIIDDDVLSKIIVNKMIGPSGIWDDLFAALYSSEGYSGDIDINDIKSLATKIVENINNEFESFDNTVIIGANLLRKV